MHDYFLGSWKTRPWKLTAHMLLARRLSQQGSAGKMSLRREGGWRRRTPLSWLHRCTSAIPILMLPSEGTPPSVAAFAMCPVPNTSLPTCPLATLLGMHHAGFEVSVRYAGAGGAAGHWSGCWVSSSHHVPPAPPCLELGRLCHCFYILWLL